MARVFLSYDRDDVSQARAMATALERAGHSVWWDRQINAGAQYSKEIENALERADAVVVLWSTHAVESAWVRDEAAAGRDNGRLVPVSIESIDAPLGFRQYQTIDLSRWNGRASSPQLKAVAEAVEALAADDRVIVPPAKEKLAHSISWQSRLPTAVVALLLIVGIGAALISWKPWTQNQATLISVGAADNERMSDELARDLLVKLGGLPAAHAEFMRLVARDEGSAGDADLILETAGSARGGATRASLILKGGEDRAILWSQEFERPSSNLADLKQQMAFTSARVFDCALDGLQAGRQLKPQTLKIYLNACSRLADIAATDSSPAIPMLLSVLDDAPRFTPAWRMILLAEANSISLISNQGEPADPQSIVTIRDHIRKARHISPNLAEADLAEAELLPPREFRQHIELIDRAGRQSPDDPVVLGYRSMALARVGRTTEAVEFAKRAAQIDPLSPSALQAYISTLAYSGRFEAAERELRRAERLWAGTVALRDAQFRYHYRHGDPKVALSMEESDSPGGFARMYLTTRLAPSKANVERLFAMMGKAVHLRSTPAGRLGFATLGYGEFGGNEELFQLLLNWPNPDHLGALAESLFRPQLKEFRRDPRFIRVAERAGLADYWRASGKWPDFCFEPDHPYDCKAVASKHLARRRT